MSGAAFAYDVDSAKGAKTKAGPSSLRVSRPGDSYELEADRVAETVSRGGRISAWSLGTAGFGSIARQPAAPDAGPAPQAQGTSTTDILGKLAEAFMATKAGQDIQNAIKGDPVVKSTTDFLTTPGGMVVAGSAAVGAVSALAATHQPLPLQIPKIPLDKIQPGLSLKITYEGPVNHPTAASLTLSFEGKPPDKKSKKDATDSYRAETQRIREDQEKFRAGMTIKGGPSADELAEQRAINEWQTRRLAAIGGIGAKKDLFSFGDSASPVSPTPGAKAPAAVTPAASPQPVPDKKPDQKLPAPPVAAPDKDKREDISVQRKAESLAEAWTDSYDVDAVLQSSGQPLDHDTRRFMETRIGFDFGKVRVHSDARADTSARMLAARAYTVGNHVVFAAGRFSPQTAEGRRLLAHELTHVVQQSAPPARSHYPVARPAPRHVQRWGLDDAKAWLFGKLRELRGYPLFCVVAEQDLITGERVERNATNLTEGVLKLFDGGPALFEKLKKAANAIEAAYQWVLAQFEDLGLSKQYFFDLIDRAINAVTINFIESFNRIKEIFKEPLDKLIELASRLGREALNFILKAVIESFPLGEKIWALIKKAGALISRIAADPGKFTLNLLEAVKTGFQNFGNNILQHLGDGLKRWIFEEIGLPGLKIPDTFDFASILSMVLRVLKLTYEERRPQLVAKLGEDAVYFFETAAKVLTRIKNEGFAAVWEMIQEQASKLFDSVIDSARDWVVTKLVKVGIEHVIALSNPVGDAIEIIKSIYETIKFFVEKATQFVELLNSIVDSFAAILDGQITSAAQKIEDTMSNSIPLILKFLADLLGLSGIGEAIRKIIDNIRKPIDDAINKVLDIIVEKAKALWEKGKEAFLGKLAAVKEWWKKPKRFFYGEEEHTITVEGEGDHPEVFIESNKTSLQHYLKDVHATPTQTATILKLAGQLKWRQGDLQKPADDAKGSSIYEQLRDELDHLKAKAAPKELIAYPQSAHSLGGGQEADAYLSSNREPGTEPNDTDPPIWNDLGYLRDAKEKFYVRGHLLSMRLGGVGQWKNMMPITNTVNQRMNSQVESKLNKAVASGKRFYHYNIKATYDSNELPPLDDKASKADQRQRALAAEKRLKSLSWTVRPARFDPDAGGWKETDGDLLDADGKTIDDRVAKGDFTPPTVRN